MKLQVLQDSHGNNTGIFIPINDWNEIVEKHADLKELVDLVPLPKRKLSDFTGTLSHETAAEMLKYVSESRNEWEDRLKR